MRIIGIILIVIGIAMTVSGSFSFQHKKKILDTNTIDISKNETKTVAWPRVAGIIVIVGGVAMVVLSGRRR